MLSGLFRRRYVHRYRSCLLFCDTVLEKRNKLFLITCQAGERGHGGTACIDDSVKRQRDRSKLVLLHLLLAFIKLSLAIRIKPYTDKLFHLALYGFARKHVGFHPAAVGAGIARKVY